METTLLGCVVWLREDERDRKECKLSHLEYSVVWVYDRREVKGTVLYGERANSTVLVGTV